MSDKHAAIVKPTKHRLYACINNPATDQPTVSSASPLKSASRFNLVTQSSILRFHISRMATSKSTNIALPSFGMMMRKNRRLASNAPSLAILLLLIRHDTSLTALRTRPPPTAAGIGILDSYSAASFRSEPFLRWGRNGSDWNENSGEVVACTPIAHFDISDTSPFLEAESV